MKFPGRRPNSAADPVAPPRPYRPLRGGPIPVTEADLPFYAALVGRAANADDRTALLVSEFELNDDQREAGFWGWRRAAGRLKQMLSSLRRAG